MLSVLVLVRDVVRDREVVLVVVDGAELHGPARGHKGIYSDGVERTGELVPVRPLRKQARERELFEETLLYLQVLLDLPLGVVVIDMGGVGLEEVYLSDPDERPGHLGLVTERRSDLVGLERQICVGPYPEGEHRVHGGLARRPQQHRHVKFVDTAPGDPVDLGVEALDVLGLLRELGLRDEDRKGQLVVVRPLHLSVDQRVDELHHLPAVRLPDVHPLDGVSLVAEVGLLHDVVVPVVEVHSTTLWRSAEGE